MAIQKISEGGIILFDFNRTLQDNPEFSRTLNQHIKGVHPEVYDTICEEEQRTELRGESFDTLANLEILVGHEKTNDLKESFIKFTRDRNLRFLNPGAEDILATLRDKKIAHGILTTGTVESQKFQIGVSQLWHVPRLVIDRKDKGRMIAEEEWIDDDGHVRVPPELMIGDVGLFLYTLLVDDKATAFDDAPEGSWRYGSPRGFFGNYFIDRRRQQVASQLGKVPKEVITIHDLCDIQLPPRPL